jgi:hypothetical protein
MNFSAHRIVHKNLLGEKSKLICGFSGCKCQTSYYCLKCAKPLCIVTNVLSIRTKEEDCLAFFLEVTLSCFDKHHCELKMGFVRSSLEFEESMNELVARNNSTKRFLDFNKKRKLSVGE